MTLAQACTILLALLLLASGCSTRATAIDSGSECGGPRPDTLQPDLSPTGPWSFFPEDDGTASPAVALRSDPAGGDPGALIVVARGVAKLQRLAFRLSFDPKQVRVVKQEVGGSWYGSGNDVVSKFALRPEGELWAGIGYSGSFSLPASSEVTLARLQLEPSGSAPAKLSFRTGRNLVLDPDAAGVEVSWLGGSFRRSTK